MSSQRFEKVGSRAILWTDCPIKIEEVSFHNSIEGEFMHPIEIVKKGKGLWTLESDFLIPYKEYLPPQLMRLMLIEPRHSNIKNIRRILGSRFPAILEYYEQVDFDRFLPDFAPRNIGYTTAGELRTFDGIRRRF